MTSSHCIGRQWIFKYIDRSTDNGAMCKVSLYSRINHHGCDCSTSTHKQSDEPMLQVHIGSCNPIGGAVIQLFPLSACEWDRQCASVCVSVSEWVKENTRHTDTRRIKLDLYLQVINWLINHNCNSVSLIPPTPWPVKLTRKPFPALMKMFETIPRKRLGMGISGFLSFANPNTLLPCIGLYMGIPIKRLRYWKPEPIMRNCLGNSMTTRDILHSSDWSPGMNWANGRNSHWSPGAVRMCRWWRKLTSPWTRVWWRKLFR